MAYIVRVVGYNSYWTGNTELGKLWSTDILESLVFDTKEEATSIINDGINMEVVEYDFATSDIQQNPPDWDAIDAEEKRLKNIEKLESDDFETISDYVYDVDVSILD